MDKMVRSVCKSCHAPIWLLADETWVPLDGSGGSWCPMREMRGSSLGRYPYTHVPRKEQGR